MIMNIAYHNYKDNLYPNKSADLITIIVTQQNMQDALTRYSNKLNGQQNRAISTINKYV